MYIIGADDRKSIVVMLEKMLEKSDPGGEHRFYTDPFEVIKDLDKPVEVAFIDVEMPGMDGIELAKRITARYPLCNIIFLTGYSEYMPSAFEMHASGYLLKPFSQKKIEDALMHRRYRVPDVSDRPVKVQCFGSFEVFINEEAVKFSRQKSKELLAYLIDRKGAMCSMDMLIGNLYPDEPPDDNVKSKVRVYISDLISTFNKSGIDELIIKNGGTFGINTKLLNCDYYRYLDSDPFVISRYTGEYMTQYSFAEDTRAFLEMKYYKDNDIG
ncbi:MAG: response regulator [Oscillospiraceae bacterium]|nr:response regulator [Oscillospiraceae bacterium]